MMQLRADIDVATVASTCHFFLHTLYNPSHTAAKHLDNEWVVVGRNN